MRRNSGIINSFPYAPTSLNASGVFDSFDAFSSKRTGTWPITIKYSSITVNSSTSPQSLNEGSTFTVVVATEGITSGTLYYSIIAVGGTILSGDFIDGTGVGSFTVTNNTGTFTKELLADGQSEAGDAFQVQIRTGSISGPIVLTSSTITINDPTFTLSMTSATVNEGFNPEINFSATNWNSQILYWRSSNAADDNTSGLTQSTFFYTAGSTSTFYPYTLKKDMITEGNETHTISIYNNTNTYLLASTTYTAVDTSLSPTFSISPGTSVNEGDVVTFTVTFPGGPTSGTIYWSTTGTAVASDFTDNVLIGTASISASGSDGTATITRTIRRDFLTDGSKTFAILLYRDGPSTTQVATSSTVTIADTCQLPTITPDSVSINEGGTVTFTVNTTGVVNGTVFPVKMSIVSSVSGSGSTTDFSDNTLDTSVTITSNTGTFTRTWASDTFTEGTEVWKANLYYPAADILANQILISSANITVGDTSTGTAEPLQALYSFTSFTFTNAGITGRTGPTLGNCLASYSTATYPWLNNTAYFNVVTIGYQLWTVPQTGTYRITAIGAAGGASYSYSAGSGVAGLGARMVSTFSLTAGQKLKILVGQAGTGNGNNSCGTDGGGGVGTFVATEANVAMLVAGGGGGAGSNSFLRDLTLKNAPGNFIGMKGSGTTGGVGGTNGNGGGVQSGSCVSGGGAGAGFTGNGATDGQAAAAISFINGGTGGLGGQGGGFGGGGGAGVNYAGGGGGGYSGGGGGGLQNCACNDMGNGGGGAVYSSTTYTYTGSIGTANGSVFIELL